MRQKSQTRPTAADKTIKDIRRATRKQYSAEEKIRMPSGESLTYILMHQDTLFMRGFFLKGYGRILNGSRLPLKVGIDGP